jgi:hypothetical protein
VKRCAGAGVKLFVCGGCGGATVWGRGKEGPGSKLEARNSKEGSKIKERRGEAPASGRSCLSSSFELRISSFRPHMVAYGFAHFPALSAGLATGDSLILWPPWDISALFWRSTKINIGSTGGQPPVDVLTTDREHVVCRRCGFDVRPRLLSEQGSALEKPGVAEEPEPVGSQEI